MMGAGRATQVCRGKRCQILVNGGGMCAPATGMERPGTAWFVEGHGAPDGCLSVSWHSFVSYPSGQSIHSFIDLERLGVRVLIRARDAE